MALNRWAKRLIAVTGLCAVGGAGALAVVPCTAYPFTTGCGPLLAANLNSSFASVYTAITAAGTAAAAALASAVATLTARSQAIAETNAALALLSTASNTYAVRRGVLALGDAPEELFVAQTGTCVSNSMVSDVGSCVNASDGGSWKIGPHAEGVDVRQWGVKFDDSTDNSTALQSALTWMITGTGSHVLRCPAQASPARFSTALTATFASQTASGALLGPGIDLCVLKYTGTGTAITVTYNSANGKTNSTHWRSFTLCTNQTGSATGIKLVETAFTAGQIAMNDFTTVALRGCDGWGITNYWAQAIDIQGVSTIDFRGIAIIGGSGALGNSVALAGNSGAGLYGFQYNFSGVDINNQLDAITIGTLVQGVTVTSGSNFTTVSSGVKVTSGTGTDQLVVSDSQFNCTFTCISSQMSDVFIHNNYFILSANSAIGVNTTATNGLHISHNVYRNGGAFTNLIGEIIGLGIAGLNNIIDHNTYLSLAYSRAYTVAGDYPDVVDGNMYYALTNAFPLLFGGVTVLTDQSLTFATVSACSAALLDRKQHINNSTTAVWGANVAAAGANDVWARCNTNWHVMGN